MNNDLIRGAVSMSKGGIARLAATHGQRVECLMGTLWITQDGDARDVILEAGESFEFDRPGPALVSALAASRYLLLGAAATVVFTAPAP